MLTLIRRIIYSRVGVIVTLGVLIAIAISFGLEGNMMGLGGGISGDSVATVGKEDVTITELRRRTDIALQNIRQEQPTVDIVQFVNAGGVDNTLDGIINQTALAQFAGLEGIVASKQLVDGRIASAPDFKGLDGKFSQTLYDQALSSGNVSDRQLHDQVGRSTLSQHLILPITGNPAMPNFGAYQVPTGVALPYASLELEKRGGQLGFIPTPAMGQGAPPTDAELATFYKRNIVRYTVPERRSVRYALVTPDMLKALITPTETEIAQAYQKAGALFAPTEKRDLVQVVVADQPAAAALAAKVKAGAPIADAARAAGLEANGLQAVEKAAYVKQSSPEIANAAFSAPKGTVIGPIRTGLGYVVVRVDAIQQIPGKSLEQARPELVTTLTTEKTQLVITDLRDKIDDAIAHHATFDELIRDHKLTAAVSPPLLKNGTNPDDPASKPDPAFAQAVAAGFGSELEDDPQVAPMGADGSFAIVKLAKIVPAAARPLAQIREGVAHDFIIDRAQRASRQAAIDVVARINKGMPIAQSIAETKLQLPPVKPIPDTARGQANAIPEGNQARAPLMLMFSMKAKTAKMLEAPGKAGWYILYLDHILPGDARGQVQLLEQARSELGQAVAREYAQQFSEAVRRQLGVKKNPKAIDDVKAALTGHGGSN
ncbi:MAG: peptidyl-prolyl cis-trans isomerase [Sphingomonas bacterium]